MNAFQVLQILGIYLGLIFVAALASIVMRARARRRDGGLNPEVPDVAFNLPMKHVDDRETVPRDRVAYADALGNPERVR